MASTRELVQELYDKRRNLIEQERELFAQMEARADGPTAEDNQKREKLSEDIGGLKGRIDMLLSMEEQNKDTDAQRERFERLIKPDGSVGSVEKETEDRIRTFMRAGLPNAEVWAPRAITFNLESHDLVAGTAGDGAELVPVGFVRRLYEHMVEMAAIRQTNAQVIQTASGENLLVPKTTTHGAAAAVAEAGALGESDPQFGQVTLVAWKFGQLIQVSTELIEDTAVDLLGYLARAAGRNIGLATGVQYINGDGTTEPQGITISPTAGKTGIVDATPEVRADDLIDLYHSIISGYRANSYWFMNDLTAAAIRKIRDDTGGAGLGNYVWQPGLRAGTPDTIFNRPVVLDPNMATIAANAYTIAFGDFSEFYTIRDVRQVRFERSDDYAFANDLVTFRAVFRTDGKQVVNGADGAVKFFRHGAAA
jgi:HK97 family phage major capsid protein